MLLIYYLSIQDHFFDIWNECQKLLFPKALCTLCLKQEK